MNEYDSNLMLLKDFREPLLLSLHYRTENNGSCKHKFESCRSWGQISFLVSLGIVVQISRFSKLSIHSKVVLLITFLQNYASTANTQEVMKFYNLGNKNFETD